MEEILDVDMTSPDIVPGARWGVIPFSFISRLSDFVLCHIAFTNALQFQLPPPPGLSLCRAATTEELLAGWARKDADFGCVERNRNGFLAPGSEDWGMH